MTTICSWCGEFQQEKPPLDDRRVSHTICDKCREVLYGEIQPIDPEGDLFGQMTAITREHAERIMAEKGDRV